LRGGKGSLDDDDAAMLGESKPQDAGFEVHPDNWQAVVLFSQLSTQWRWHETHRIGLIYQEVHSLMRLHAVREKMDCFARIQIMEREVLDVEART